MARSDSGTDHGQQAAPQRPGWGEPLTHALELRAPVTRERLYRQIYPARVLGMALGGLPVAAVLWQQHAAGGIRWVLLGLMFFVWPHGAYWLARRSAKPYDAERRNLLADSAIVGFWIALMHFNLLVSLVLTVVTTLDKAYTLIRRWWLYSLLLLLAVAALTALVLQPPLQPDSTLLVQASVLPLMFVHTWVNTYRGTRLMRTIARQNRQLAELRRTDAQTGLQSREHWMQRAAEALAAAAQQGQSMTLLLIDVDHFKSINDTYGHTVGDEVISAVGAVIAAQVGPHDSAGRYGGDEFAVVIGPAPVAAARAVAEAIRQQIGQLRLPGAPGLRLGSSIGLAVAQPSGTLRNWIDAADAALYRAKQRGRNCVAEAD